jgi:hydroxymethylpyrimidine/phosphomethylpyrimidine kinase
MSRTPAPDDRPVVLAVAGSDAGGGAGVQADLKTIEAGGAFGTSAVTAVTAQNTRGVASTHVLPVGEVAAQTEAVLSDFDVAAVKTGMLATAGIVERVREYAADLDAPLVVDPVIVAESGDRLLDAGAETAYEGLIGEATLVTPNAAEATALTGVEVTDRESAAEAGWALVDAGADAALVTGGHLPTDRVVDTLVTAPEGGDRTFARERVDTDATHGSGCTLSSAVATRLAHGDGVGAAVEAGTEFVARAIRYGHAVGAGPGAVNHLAPLRERAAREPTAEAVRALVRAFVDADVSAAIPEVGTNVVGATPYAERPGETAAVEGRLSSTRDGVTATGGVRFGASSHVARLLLAAREFDPSLCFAANCRFDADAVAALDDGGGDGDGGGSVAAAAGPVVEVDRRGEPEPDAEGETMEWVVRRAFERVDRTPAAVYDRGAVGKEPMVRVLAPDRGTLRDRVLRLAAAAEGGG